VEELLWLTGLPSSLPEVEAVTYSMSNFSAIDGLHFIKTGQGHIWGQDAVLLLYKVVIGQELEKWRLI
jgi:hypothetical protein